MDTRIYDLNPSQIIDLENSSKHFIRQKDKSIRILCEKALEAVRAGKKFRVVLK